MLVSFSVANFRSFSKEQTFSLVASGRLSGTHESHTIPIPDSEHRVLRVGVLYGANGAGKSNLFKALDYLTHRVLTARKASGTARVPFRFTNEPDTPSSFDIQFIAKDKLYRYAIKVGEKHIDEEWLVHVVGQKEILVYERVTDEDGTVTINAPGLKGDEKTALLAKIGGLGNQTFLATVRATLRSSELTGHVEAILDWFHQQLQLTGPDENLGPLASMLADEDGFRHFAGEFLKAASTGVFDLEIDKREVTEEDLESFLPKPLVSRMLKDLAEDSNETAVVQLPSGSEIEVQKKDSEHFYLLSIHSTHRVHGLADTRLALNEESDGTQRLLQLLPALHWAKNRGVYFIDEIDRSMHPLLIWKFVEAFLAACNSQKSQLIVTTHESNLLDLDLLRRDEIWFAEKDATLSTHLYSLSDFKIRKDLEIRKHYLTGRFGAVPFLGRLDNLIYEAGEK
jgi:AAA15 family ATPase/GTPase